MSPSHRHSAVVLTEDPEEPKARLEADGRSLECYHSTTWKLFGPLAWSCTTLMLAAVLILLVAAYTREPSRQECNTRMLEWSPALEAVELIDVKFQNAFLEHTIYRGTPNPEHEKAWLDLWDFSPVNIPYDKLDALNKSRDGNWQRATPEDGGGVIGSLEVFHHIHCLDLVRQYTYRDEYDYSKLPAFDGTPKQIRTHVDHCINSLRVSLQCKVDITPYLNVVAPETLLGLDVDFNTQHKCINFEEIRSWAKEHELDNTKYQTVPHR